MAVRRYMVFAAGSAALALPVSAVDRVLESASTAPLPGAAPCLLGLSQAAGRSQLVLDVAAALSPGPAGTASDVRPIWVALAGSAEGLTLQLAGPFAFCAGGHAVPRPPAQRAICDRAEKIGDAVTGILSLPRLLVMARRQLGPLNTRPGGLHP